MSLKDDLLAFGVRKLLDYRARPGAIRQHVQAQFAPYAAAPTRERVTVAAVQLEATLLDDGARYADKIFGLAREAVLRGAQLVALPEYAWLPLIGMLPGVRQLAAQATGGLDGAAAGIGGVSLPDILRLVAPAVERAFVATGREVARALRIYLMSGSTLSVDAAGRLFNVAYLFGPDGALIGSQHKLHAFVTERDWLCVGSSLETFALPFATVALPVCMDYTYWEVTRLAWLDGAEILFNPSADSEGEHELLAARGVRARVQEAPAYGILCNLVTDLFGLHFRGPSRIVAPLGLDPRGSTLARAARADREEIVVAELDLARLREFRAAHPPEINRALHARYFPHAYEEYRARVRRDGKRLVNPDVYEKEARP